MEAVRTDIRSASLVGIALVLPLAILEFVHTTITTRNAPGLALLFALLWLLPVASIVAIMPVVRIRGAASTLSVSLRLLLALVFTAIWIALLIDQWPCFLGVPNCD